MTLDTQQIYLISSRANADVKTVRNWTKLELRLRMKPATVRRLNQAAADLGITLQTEAHQAERAHVVSGIGAQVI